MLIPFISWRKYIYFWVILFKRNKAIALWLGAVKILKAEAVASGAVGARSGDHCARVACEVYSLTCQLFAFKCRWRDSYWRCVVSMFAFLISARQCVQGKQLLRAHGSVAPFPTH